VCGRLIETFQALRRLVIGKLGNGKPFQDNAAGHYGELINALNYAKTFPPAPHRPRHSVECGDGALGA